MNLSHDNFAKFFYRTEPYHTGYHAKSVNPLLWAVIYADPMIFERSLSVQVKKFIVKSFLKLAKTPRSASAVVIIDGLDECDGDPIQGEIVRLWTGPMPFWKIRANSPALLLPRVSSLTQLRSRN
ncbi:hypothetical protein BD779DRAFT_1675580 [Infundibulicybe gibba]|nr:hypothetical protein BD779DRAFT_1675580 [Infundibulicybe gibba]